MEEKIGDVFDLNGVSSEVDDNAFLFNLHDVDENAKSEFPVLPKGTYDAVIDEFSFGMSKSNNPMITVKFEITDAEYANTKIFDYIVLGGKAQAMGLQRLKKLFVRVYPDFDISSISPKTLKELEDEGVMIGKPCTLKLKIQTQKGGDYAGTKRNNVADILAPDNSSFLG